MVVVVVVVRLQAFCPLDADEVSAESKLFTVWARIAGWAASQDRWMRVVVVEEEEV